MTDFFNKNFFHEFRVLPDAFGVDLSDTGLKFVYITKHKDEYEVAAFGERTFEEGVVSKGKVLNASKLAGILRETTLEQKRRGVFPSHAIVGFPEENIFIRVLQMPQMSVDELSQAIAWEIEGNIPLSIDDVYYAHEVIPFPADGLDHMDVLVAAAPKEAVDGYIAAFALAGVQPLVVEPTSAALVRALIPLRNEKDDIVLLDLGAKHTQIVIYAKGALRLTSSIPLSSEDFITNLRRVTGYTRQEAERALYTYGLSKGAEGGKLFEAFIPTLTDLKEQVEKYMNFQKAHREHEHGEEISSFSSLIVAGGGALIPGMSEYFSEMFGIPVHLADPWINLPVHHKGEVPHIPYRDALRFAPTIGLALRGALPVRSLDTHNFFAP